MNSFIPENKKYLGYPYDTANSITYPSSNYKNFYDRTILNVSSNRISRS
jgi:hypothetical protein